LGFGFNIFHLRSGKKGVSWQQENAWESFTTSRPSRSHPARDPPGLTFRGLLARALPICWVWGPGFATLQTRFSALCRLWRQRGDGRRGSGAPDVPTRGCGSGGRGQALGVLAARSRSWIYCWCRTEGVREPAKGFGVQGLGFPIAPPPAGVNPAGAS